MTRILVLEDSKDCLNAITAMLEKVSDRVCACLLYTSDAADER